MPFEGNALFLELVCCAFVLVLSIFLKIMGQEQSSASQGNQIPVEFDSDIAYRNNRSNQRNPNNDAYWQSRSYDRRPNDWKEKIDVRLPQGNDNNRSKQLNPNHPLYTKSRGQSGELQSASYKPEVTEEGTSTMENVMWCMQTASLAYATFEVGRQVYNYMSEPQQEEEEERPQQRRND